MKDFVRGTKQYTVAVVEEGWRWKKAVLVIWLTWGRNERVGSRMTPRLRIWVDNGAINIEFEFQSEAGKGVWANV